MDAPDKGEDLYNGETDEIVEEVAVEEAVMEGGDDSTQDNDKHMGENANAEPMSTETSNTPSQQNERVNDTNGDDLIELSVSTR